MKVMKKNEPICRRRLMANHGLLWSGAATIMTLTQFRLKRKQLRYDSDSRQSFSNLEHLNLAKISLWNLNYEPHPDQLPYVERARVQENDFAQVSVAVLTPAECKVVFGVPLANRGIQAVWVRIVNRSPVGTRLLMTKVAPDYFTAREAAGVCHFSILKRLLGFGFLLWILLPFIPILMLTLPFKLFATRRANNRMNDCFQSLGFPLKTIEPGATAQGIVYTPVEFGTKVVDIALVINKEIKNILFSIDVPAPQVDHQNMLTDELKMEECDYATLKTKLTQLPPTTSNATGTRSGDPVNLVIIGNFPSVIGVFAPRWDQTEIITLGSCWRTAKAFLLGTEYRYSPVSALYLFDVPQSFALQRVRESINERLHLRLWRTPWSYEGKAVWVGQVSRDIGVRFTWQTWNLTTHRIDPNVDEARDYVMEDLFEAGRITAGGYFPGIGACTKESPRHNLTGDPYFTDGNRAVIVVSDQCRIPELLKWN